jgi:hypothetical protein
MTRAVRPLLATALAAAVSLGATSQVHAITGTADTTEERATTAASAAPRTMTESTKTSDAQRAASYVKQWKFDPNRPHHPLRAKTDFNGPANRNVNLTNSMERRFLQWEHQTWGINLGWTDDASPATAKRVSRWFFTRKDTTHPLWGQNCPGIRRQPVVHLLRTPNRRHQPRLVAYASLRVETARRENRQTGEIRRLAGHLQHRDQATPHLLRPDRGRRHRLAR